VPYLIDGHNLIGYIPGLSLDDPHDEAKLVERLKSYSARTGKRITVIFDSGLPGGPSRDLSTYSVRVVFAHGGTTADAIILERIHETRDPGNWTVISADHELVDAARRRRMSVLSPAEFAALLVGPPASKERDPRLTPDEINDWLRIFGIDPDTEPPD
jgi:hypothetical protein